MCSSNLKTRLCGNIILIFTFVFFPGYNHPALMKAIANPNNLVRPAVETQAVFIATVNVN